MRHAKSHRIVAFALHAVGCSSDPSTGYGGAGSHAGGNGGLPVTAGTGGFDVNPGAGSGGTSGTPAGAAGNAGQSSGGTDGGSGAAGSAGSSDAAGSGGSGGSAAGGGSGGGSAGDGASGFAGSGGSAGSGPLVPLTLYIAGDSTVQNYPDTAKAGEQAGWGQMIGARVGSLVTIQNRAVGGRTARRFIDEDRLDDILADLRAGDYFLVQFGTNDGNRTATYALGGQTIPYYLEPGTDFKRYLQMYIDGARARQATPVLVTPPPRNSAYCTGGNGTVAHAEAMRELGTAQNVAVVDLNAKTVAHLRAICPAPTPENFFLLRADGTVDGTHFQENGARVMAGFVTDEMKRLNLALARYLQ